MKMLALLFSVVALSCSPLDAAETDVARWERQAKRVTITRDDWGIPHIKGKSDADAVFGLMYAQAEDDFNRVETNFINAMGRLAEAEGESEIYRDLRMKLFVNPDSMKARYRASPAWLKALMTAHADGLNYYLHKHPDVKPRVITRFEPWMALTFSEGSIGGDIEGLSTRDLEAFYGKRTVGRALAPEETGPREPSGSNGIAIAPSNNVNKRAMLLINPHTSFFFRAEAKIESDEGLNVYGALTWGQFFVYQGFNEKSGWMHTSSNNDSVDEYAETVVEKNGKRYYRYGNRDRLMTASKITVPYKTPTGMSKKEFTVYRTHHGPIIAEKNGKWVSVRLMDEPLKALTQSYTRTKARNYREFRRTMELHTNSSNNTVFADAEGNIAYFHANFIPRKDASFNWEEPVDGSNPATEWKGVLSISQSPHLLNPPNGWIQNTNNWPYSAAGAYSPRKSDFPSYVETTGENARGIHAIRVLEHKRDFTIQALIDAAYDSYLPAFDTMLPSLFEAYDKLAADSPLKAKVAEQVAMLRTWDRRWSVTSVPTSLAVFWGEQLGRRAAATPEQRVEALASASDRLAADFGSWKTPWGEINRFQRLTGDIVQPFADSGASIPVGFTSATWGSLASFGARRYPGTKRMYGTSGNSFVAVVEFGKDSVRARAVSAGGQNGKPSSKHFVDQAERYSTGNLREVYFYPSQLKAHTVRKYNPGD